MRDITKREIEKNKREREKGCERKRGIARESESGRERERKGRERGGEKKRERERKIEKIRGSQKKKRER